jgi:hypothetical protein
MVATFAIGLVLIHLAGGDLRRLNDLELRRSGLAAAALVTQVAIISLWPDGWRLGHLLLNLATYLAIAVVLWANRRIRALWIVAAGTVANTTAIAANGGIMPASRMALRIAGLATGRGFVNSAAVTHAHLGILGDVLPTPAWFPLHNVASLGDILIVAGALAVVAAQARTPAPAGPDPAGPEPAVGPAAPQALPEPDPAR